MQPAAPPVGVLDHLRARGAFALRAVLAPPWGLRVLARSPLTVIAIVSGEAWILPDGGAPLRLGPGDVAVTRGPETYTVADGPDTLPDIVIHPGQRCTDLAGNSVLERMSLGVRTWGNDPAGGTVMLVGAYEEESVVGGPLARALPPVIGLSREEWDSPLVPLLCAEVVRDEPGQAAVLDRLIDLLAVAVLRAWFARSAGPLPSSDPVVARALDLLRGEPAREWTLRDLARATGASRAALARRFRDEVGEPPMAFLRNWRLALAADLLADPAETVGTVAAKVGYRSPFAFSVAFKRTRGTSPQNHRRAAARSPG